MSIRQQLLGHSTAPSVMSVVEMRWLVLYCLLSVK